MSKLSNEDIQNLREDYQHAELDEKSVSMNPFDQFHDWFSDSLKANLKEPNAMTLATVASDGFPSARIVLLKGFDKDGFVFYTNYDSRKGKELMLNNKAALVFHWVELERQVRIEGLVIKTSRETSEKYFRTRPRGSQLGALSSPQSSVISDRSVLEIKAEKMKAAYSDLEIPLPKNWGGFVVQPHQIEFWQGRRSRLHDRILYQKNESGIWEIVRLAP